MCRDHAACLHVGEHHFAVGDAGTPGNLDPARRQARVIARLGEAARFAQRHVQQLVGVEHDLVRIDGKTEFSGLRTALRHRGHGDGHEHRLDELEGIVARSLRCVLRGAHGELLAATAGWNQADTGFHQTDVALERDHPLGRVHDEFATATQGHPLHRCNHRHLGVLEGHRRVLEFADVFFEQLEIAGGNRLGNFLEVGTKGEWRFVPQHQSLIIGLGTRHHFLQTDDDVTAERMVARFDAGDGDTRIDLRQRPHADAFVFPDRAAGDCLFTEDALGEDLPLIHRQGRARPVGVGTRRVGTLRAMHACLCNPAKDPCRQRGRAHRPAGVDVGLDGFGNRLPASRLPALERALRPAEAPAHREIEIAGIVGNVGEVISGVMEDVAEDRPQELRLRMLAGAQLGKLLGRVAILEDRQHAWVDFGRTVTIVLQRQVEHLDRPAILAENAAARLLAERALADQCRQPCRHAVMGMPGIFGQGVLHGLDDMCQGIEANDVGGTIGGTLRATDDRTGQRIDDVETESEALRVMHHREHREDTDTVGDEVRRIARTHDALAEARDQPRFEMVEQRRISGSGRDQFDEMHVTRRIEEVDAAEARTQCFRQTFGEAIDRQPRGIRGDDRSGRNEGCDLAIQIVLPLGLFGNGFDDQVAIPEQIEVLQIIGGVDVADAILRRQR
ncbi:MAG: hypothetical protein AW09_002256 [Candidatus Accumulibacter phosphatis]|uniref:Uncharacterized protein n=1 Tax=Candidatus Accumulibacter phosphatis TaxID=327160 RepID=A0A080LVE1_9PROT|nr:MAG: hypothetical protein AW09_002256 [Candidatus Accumulibacter phosphatis]